MSTITLEKAVEVCREIEDKLKPIGYHCGLTGSILYKGESEKDIDIIVYPHQIKETVSLNKILDTLGVYTEMYGTQGCQKPSCVSSGGLCRVLRCIQAASYAVDWSRSRPCASTALPGPHT